MVGYPEQEGWSGCIDLETGKGKGQTGPQPQNPGRLERFRTWVAQGREPISEPQDERGICGEKSIKRWV